MDKTSERIIIYGGTVDITSYNYWALVGGRSQLISNTSPPWELVNPNSV